MCISPNLTQEDKLKIFNSELEIIQEMQAETNQTSKVFANIGMSLADEPYITPPAESSDRVVETETTEKNPSPSDKMEKNESELGTGIKFTKMTLSWHDSEENGEER